MYEKKLEEYTITVPRKMILDFKEANKQESYMRNELVILSSRNNLEHKQPNQVREAMIKGYVEMSHINLSIASECLHAEYEAQHMVERLVSGG
ncbi:MAG: hypothetical protein RR595_01325 [Lysinibacillus sp.]